MKTIVQFAGVDWGDKVYHVSVYNSDDRSIFAFKCAFSPEILIRAPKKHKLSKTSLKICYEASYIGYSLIRSLVKSGYNCQITAPSLIPKQPGFGQKTDEIDSKKWEIYLAYELLTFIHIPDKSDESVRDLLRSKLFLLEQHKVLKNHIFWSSLRTWQKILIFMKLK